MRSEEWSFVVGREDVKNEIIYSQLDCLQDELRAWWRTASKDASRVLPLVADLRAKVKKKKELGF